MNDELVTLVVDPASFRQSARGTISGQIFIRMADGGFPMIGWSDVVLPVLAAWVRAFVAIENGSSEERIYFMDGPYYVDVLAVSPQMLLMNLIEDREVDASRREVRELAERFLHNLLKACDDVLAECERRGWRNDDVEDLLQLRSVLKENRGH